jgi:hypothetical protein
MGPLNVKLRVWDLDPPGGCARLQAWPPLGVVGTTRHPKVEALSGTWCATPPQLGEEKDHLSLWRLLGVPEVCPFGLTSVSIFSGGWGIVSEIFQQGGDEGGMGILKGGWK